MESIHRTAVLLTSWSGNLQPGQAAREQHPQHPPPPHHRHPLPACPGRTAVPEHATLWHPQPTSGLRGVQEPQRVLVAHVGPLAEQGVDVGQTGPLPAGRAGQQHGQGTGRRVAIVTLLPQPLAVGVHQPTAVTAQGGDGTGLAGWGCGVPLLPTTRSAWDTNIPLGALPAAPPWLCP